MLSKKKGLFSIVLVLALAVVLAACGAPAAEATEAPAAAEAPASEAPAADAPAATEAPAAAGDVVAQFVFTNTGSVELCELYLSPVGVESWGPDQLAGQTIPAGQKFTLKNIPAATYDAKVVGCGGAGEQVIQVDIKN